MKTIAIMFCVLSGFAFSPGGGISAQEEQDPSRRDENYFACFDFASLVPGGTVRPNWQDDESFWWIDGGDTLAATFNGNFIEPEPDTMPPAGKDENAPPPIPDLEISESLPGPTGTNALIIADNLWLEKADGQRIQVTFDGSAQQPWSLWGGSWSPAGDHLALQRFDMTAAPTIPIVDWLDPLAPVTREPSTQAREPRLAARLHLVSADGTHVVVVPDEPTIPEPMWYASGWVPGSGELLAVRFNRVMNRQDLLAIDPATGNGRSVVTEHSDTFIDGLAASFMLDWYFTPLEDGKHFVWLSERDGFHHLYLYQYDGTLVRRLTRGSFPVLKIEGIDHENGWIYFMAKPDPDDPTSRHLCRVDFEGNGFRQLTTSPGRRTVHLSPGFEVFVENHSDLDRPAASVLRRVDGTFLTELASADTSALQDLGWTPPELAMAKADDDTSDCFCAIYLPPGFDPSLSYPVIEVIYAGPQWMIVPRRMPAGEYGDTAAALAQLGYVAVIIDSPGTAGIGLAYQDAVFERLGQVEVPDHVAAIRNLATTRPWMDLSRVGVHGKSWGGYFALRAMLMAPDFYKAGVASSVVADLATTAESPVVPYLGLPADNPEAYGAADCLAMADKLKGNLLLTIGTADRNTPFGQTMRMLDAFTQAGKDVELLVLPGQHHWLEGASFTRWQRALRDHFLEHLPPGPSREKKTP